MTATATTWPSTPSAGVPAVQLAALAVLAERADNALETAVRRGAGASEVRAAQDYADAAEARLHRALLIAAPSYGREDLDAAIDAASTAAARIAGARR